MVMIQRSTHLHLITPTISVASMSGGVGFGPGLPPDCLILDTLTELSYSQHPKEPLPVPKYGCFECLQRLQISLARPGIPPQPQLLDFGCGQCLSLTQVGPLDAPS